MHTENMNFIKPKGSPKLLAYNPMQDINSPIHGKILIYEYSISNSINGPRYLWLLCFKNFTLQINLLILF